MLDYVHLFDKNDTKTDTITIRVSHKQRERIRKMAGRKSMSAFILSLIQLENERQISEGLIDFFDIDEGIPF